MIKQLINAIFHLVNKGCYREDDFPRRKAMSNYPVDYEAAALNYYYLITRSTLSEVEAKRLEELLEFAEKDSYFAVLTHVIDEFSFKHADLPITDIHQPLKVEKEYRIDSELVDAYIQKLRGEDIGKFDSMVQEYFRLALLPEISEIEAKRMEKILELAEHDSELEIQLRKIDEFTFAHLELLEKSENDKDKGLPQIAKPQATSSDIICSSSAQRNDRHSAQNQGIGFASKLSLRFYRNLACLIAISVLGKVCAPVIFGSLAERFSVGNSLRTDDSTKQFSAAPPLPSVSQKASKNLPASPSPTLPDQNLIPTSPTFSPSVETALKQETGNFETSESETVEAEKQISSHSSMQPFLPSEKEKLPDLDQGLLLNLGQQDSRLLTSLITAHSAKESPNSSKIAQQPTSATSQNASFSTEKDNKLIAGDISLTAQGGNLALNNASIDTMSSGTAASGSVTLNVRDALTSATLSPPSDRSRKVLLNSTADSVGTIVTRIPNGIYLFGQASEPNQAGRGYFVFESNQGKIVGAIYMPKSSFNCAYGEATGQILSLTIIDSFDKSENRYDISLKRTRSVATNGAIQNSVLGDVQLEGYQRLRNASENDSRMLSFCRTNYTKRRTNSRVNQSDKLQRSSNSLLKQAQVSAQP